MTDRPSHRSVSPGLLGTLRGFLYATAATALGGAIATAGLVSAYDEFRTGSASAVARLADAEEVSDSLLSLFAVAAFVALVLAIIWWYQAMQAIGRVAVAGRSWTPGWAIGGWFIPIANLIIPKLVLDEIDRVSAAAEEGSTEWKQRRTLPLAHIWWVVFVIGGVVLAIGTTITADQLDRLIPDPARYRVGLWLTAAGLVGYCAAALLGTAALRVIGGRLSR